MPRGGPMAAWDYTYTLVSPSGVRHELGKGQGSATNFAAGIIEKSDHVFGERSGLCKMVDESEPPKCTCITTGSAACKYQRELEKRSMSTWSAEELARYSEITGQTEKTLDEAMVKLSFALGGAFGDGHHSDIEMVLEAVRRLETA